MRDKKNEPGERFDLYRLKLHDVLLQGQRLAEIDIAQAANIIKTLNVFTKPVSIFREDEVLYAASCYESSTATVYTLVGNLAFSLLFRSDLIKLAHAVKFEQIVTIKKAKELLLVNDKQLLAISNTQCVIFQRDSTECDDMQHLF
jgi:hypothetical protein